MHHTQKSIHSAWLTYKYPARLAFLVGKTALPRMSFQRQRGISSKSSLQPRTQFEKIQLTSVGKQNQPCLSLVMETKLAPHYRLVSKDRLCCRQTWEEGLALCGQGFELSLIALLKLSYLILYK